MKKIRVNKRVPAGDRAVAIGGFILVLLTGFFGAEPAHTTMMSSGERIATATTACGGDAATNCTAH
jgi:hypothetical protein